MVIYEIMASLYWLMSAETMSIFGAPYVEIVVQNLEWKSTWEREITVNVFS